MFVFEESKSYLMPAFFGVGEYNPNAIAVANDVTTMVFTLTTNGNLLSNFLPAGFQPLRPEINIKFVQLREVDFLTGGSYNLIQIEVPVRFSGTHDQLEGVFPLVIWENNAEPIISGREQSGQPKIYADIEDLNIYQGKYFTNACLQGNTFLHLEMFNPQPVSQQQFEQIKSSSVNSNVFGWRYIPKVGGPGAELSQPILYPQGMKLYGAWMGKGNFSWIKLSEDFRYRIFNYYDIVKTLAEFPVYSLAPVQIYKGASILRPAAGRVLK
ncbi:acetoacetate decarboxylase family protein [Fictibacillus fluitans]|uniref:Acetoacetate decarboxylase family protein n=1 Tax=Fictibacillus fluitans TaxID=3058422 RepID=A0ABT8I092_9BACL|nr:acetoacetate decarboxylase family protein [Fictibacillus sp. NE201]MDN4526420.1 acetoacetate decarboxylase family protein [Fictibacillus sp. NE201]